ncbi:MULTISPECIES: hypothetical protein [unclassified Moraxella]|uniref:hypothetical protein n=1 Tax=unclassified Moraxella TaxID=2685852 RepID=UPI003AF7A744
MLKKLCIIMVLLLPTTSQAKITVSADTSYLAPYGCVETQTLCFFENEQFLAMPMGFRGDFMQSGKFTIKAISPTQSDIQLATKSPYQPFELYSRYNRTLKQGQFELTFDHDNYDRDEQKDYYDTVQLFDSNNQPIKNLTFDKSDTVLLNTPMLSKVVLTKYDKTTQQPRYQQQFQLDDQTNDIVIKSTEINEIYYENRLNPLVLTLTKQGKQAYLQDKTGKKVKLLTPQQMGKNQSIFAQLQVFMNEVINSDNFLYKNDAGNIHILPDINESDNYVYDETTDIYALKDATEYRKKVTNKFDDSSVLKVYVVNSASEENLYSDNHAIGSK